MGIAHVSSDRIIRRHNVYIAPHRSNSSHLTIFVQTKETKGFVTGDVHYFLIDDTTISGYRHERMQETYRTEELELVGTLCASVPPEECDQVLGNMSALRLDSEQMMMAISREGDKEALEIARLRCYQALDEMVKAKYLQR